MKRVLLTLLGAIAFFFASCSKSTSASVTAPTIFSDLDSTYTATVGSKFNLFISATGENPVYTWQQITLTNSSVTAATTVDGATGDTLEIVVTDIAQNGTAYRCIVSNDGGADTSKIAILEVTNNITIPEIVTDITNISGYLGKPFTLTIDALGLNRTYAWELVTIDAQGTVLTATPVAEATTGTFTGTFSADTNGKSYRCIVSNEAGSDTSSVATITAQYASIDLTGYQAPDGTTANAETMLTVGDKLYLGLQRMGANWSLPLSSLVLVVDTKTNTVIDTIECTGKNIIEIEKAGDYLYVVNSGSFFNYSDGTVERISLTDHSVEVVYSGLTDITEIEHYTGEQFFVKTYSYNMETSTGEAPVYLCDFSTDIFIDTIPGVENCNAMLFDLDNALLYIGEAPKTSKQEVKVYNTATKTVSSIPTTLNVTSMAFYGTGLSKKIILTESDYTTGHLGEISGGVYTKKLDIYSDSRVSVAGDDLFVLERNGADNLMKVTPSSPTYSVNYQNALEDLSNPSAATVINGAGYILYYGKSLLGTFDVTTGAIN